MSHQQQQQQQQQQRQRLAVGVPNILWAIKNIRLTHVLQGGDVLRSTLAALQNEILCISMF